MSDEVDTDWDNDTTVRLEFTRQSLKVISNKLSNSYSLSYCEFTLCSVLCAVPLKFSRFKFLSMWVFFLLLCVYWWKNIPQSKLWLQQCLHAEGQIQLRWALWLNICREICHLKFIQWMSVWRSPNRKTQIKNGFCPRSSYCDLQYPFFNFCELWNI